MYLAAPEVWPRRLSIINTSPGLADIGQASIPWVIKVEFHTKGRVHPDNCCPQCETKDPKTRTIVRVPLGVGVFGTGMNAIEIQFKLADHRPNFEYDIRRMKRKSTWERVGGAWNRLELLPNYLPDDFTNDDECLVPKNNSIFSMDAPGFPLLLPRDPGMTVAVSGGRSSSVNASDIIMRWSFTEFVLARERGQGPSAWVPISACYFWQSVTWLKRDAANQWVLDKNQSRIQPGAMPAQELNSPPA